MKTYLLTLFIAIASYSVGIAQTCNDPVLNISEGFALAQDNTAFDSETLPDCWTRAYPQGSNDQGSRIRRNSDGTNAFLQVASGNGSGGDNGIALMPEPLNYQGQLSFKAKIASTNNAVFDMEVVIYYGGRSVRSLGTFRLGGSWQTFSIDLASLLPGYTANGNEVSIGFRHVAANQNGTYRMDIDDVVYNSNPCLDPVYSVVDDFSTNGGALPDCWTRHAHEPNNAFLSDASIQGNELWITNNNRWEVTLPTTDNLSGVISFDAKQQLTSGGNLVFAVIASDGLGNYTELTTFTLSNTMQTYTYDLALSNYSGSYTKIGLRGADGSNPFARAVLDNLDYRSECVNPTLTVIANDITVSLDEDGNATIVPEDIDNGSQDSCGNPAILALDITQFTCADLGDNTVTLTATVGSLTETVAATVRVIPLLPTANSTTSVYLDNTGNLTVTPEDLVGVSSCSGVTYSFASGFDPDLTCGLIGANLATTLTATFNSGDTEAVSVFLIAEDTISPVLVTEDVTIQLDNSGSAILTPADVDDGSSDACSLVLSLSKSSFGYGDVGTNTITLTGTDGSGNTTSQAVTVTVESGFTEYNASTTATGSQCLDGSNSFDITLDGSDSGLEYFLIDTVNNVEIDGPLTGTGSPLVFNTGVLSETTSFQVATQASVTSGSGSALQFNTLGAWAEGNNWIFNYANGYTFEATVQGTTNPVSYHNVLFSIGNTGDSDIEAYFQAGTSQFIVLHERNGGSNFEQFTAPPNNTKTHIAISFAPNNSDVLSVYYDGVLQTSTSGNLNSSIGKSDSYRFKLGEINHTAFGSASLSDLIIDEVRIWDAPRTQATIQSLMTTCVDASSQGLTHYYRLDEGNGLGITDEIGNMDLALRGVSGTFSNWRTSGFGLVSCPTDVYVPISNLVTIGDQTAPAAILKDITLSLNGNGDVTFNPADVDDGSSDNCSQNSELTFATEAITFSCTDLGDTTVAITVTDLAGNMAVETATITIVDDTPPFIASNNIDDLFFTIFPPLTFDLDAINVVQITIDDLRSTVADNCDSDPVITLSQTSFSCVDLGSHTITITATDISGNTSTSTEIIEIVDATSPVAVGQDVTIQLDNMGNAILAPEDVNTTSSDNCTAAGDLALALSQDTFDCADLGINTITLEVTDASGNMSTATVSVTVEDLSDPTVIAQDISVELDANDQVTITPADVDNGSSDNCSFTLSLDKTSFTRADLGENTVTLTAEDVAGNKVHTTAKVTIEEAKTPQTITFTLQDAATYGDAPITLNATASSGLAVSYTVTGAGELTSSNEVKINGAGDIVVTALQSGDATFSRAAEVVETIRVAKANLTATADNLTITYGTNQLLSFSVNFTGFIGDDNALDIDQAPSAGSQASSASDAGIYPITMAPGMDDNYSFTYVSGAFTIEKADQIITFPTISDVDIAINTVVTFSASSDVGLPIIYTLVSGAGIANLVGNEVTLSGTGEVIVETTQAGTNNYNAATPVQQTFQATDSRKQDQTIALSSVPNLTYGDAPVTLNATASSGLPVTYSYVDGPASLAGNVVTITGAGTVNIEVSQSGNDAFNPASSVVQSFTVAKASLTVTADDQTITYGDTTPAFTFFYTGFVNGEDESILVSQPATTLSIRFDDGDIIDAGTYDILLSGGEATNYKLTLVNAVFTVSKADQVITITDIEEKTPDAAPFVVVATVDTDLVLTYTVTGPASISASTITLDGTEGTVTVTVSQEGNNNFNAARASTSFDVAAVLSATYLGDAITIYPNPTSDFIHVEGREVVSLQFYTLNGQLVKTVEEVSGAIDLLDLPAGIYMLRISTEDSAIFKHIIKSN